MKPFYFVQDVVKQLEGFGVKTVDFELHVGGNGYVGDGSSLLTFTIDIADYKSKHNQMTAADIKQLLGDE